MANEPADFYKDIDYLDYLLRLLNDLESEERVVDCNIFRNLAERYIKMFYKFNKVIKIGDKYQSIKIAGDSPKKSDTSKIKKEDVLFAELKSHPDEIVRKLAKKHYRLQNQMQKIINLSDTYQKELKKTAIKLEVLTEELNEKNTELKTSKEKADNANRAKSDFISTISHEIRNPVNSICGFSQRLMETDLDDNQSNYAKNIFLSSDLLLNIVNDILDFSKIEAGKMELEFIPSDIYEITNQTAEMFKHQAQIKNINLRVNIDPSVPKTGLFDPLRLKQILCNILGNAVKFTEEGEVEIKLSFDKIDDKIGSFHFSIRDTGIGISPEKQGHLFHLFSQGDKSISRRFGGTGLGLAISSNLAEKMQSRINIESCVGQGSVFYFSIKTEYSYIKFQENNLITDFSKIPSKKINILIAEDVDLNMVLMKLFINDLIPDVNIYEARNGYEAVEIFKKIKIDIIFMDIHMDVMNGLEAVKIIKKIGKETNFHVPVIALTAGVSEKEKEEIFKAGMDDFLSKPLQRKALEEIFIKYDSLVKS